MHCITRNVIQRAAVALIAGLVMPAVASEPPSSFDTLAWRADNGQNEAWLWGVGASTRALPDWLFEADFLQGQYNQGGDLEENTEFQAMASRTHGGLHAGLGYRYLGFENELRRGFVWSYPEEEIERNADIHGPILAAGWTFPVGWLADRIHVCGVVMPHDFGDLDEVGYNGRHAELEFGVSRDVHGLSLGLGYRYRYFPDVPDRIINDASFSRDDMYGFTLSAALHF